METIKSPRFIRFKLETAGDNALIKSSIDALTDTQGFDLSNFTSALYAFMGLLDEYAYTCYCSEEKGGRILPQKRHATEKGLDAEICKITVGRV